MEKKFFNKVALSKFLSELEDTNQNWYRIVENFIKKNFNYIEPIYIEDKIVGEGCFAIVFQIKGSNKILKLSTYANDRQLDELELAINLKKNNSNFPYQQTYYFEALKNNHIFILITDKHKKIEDQELYHVIYKFRIYSFIFKKIIHLDFEPFWIEMEKFYKAEDIRIKNKEYYKQLHNIYRSFTRAGLPTIDLHQSNFMLDKNNNLIVIDF